MLTNMRQDEGLAMFKDMEMRLKRIMGILEIIKLRAPQVVLNIKSVWRKELKS